MPSSPLDLTGVATYELFLRGTLDKIGVVPGPAPHRRLQDRGRTRSPRRATRRRTARWTSRSTAISTSRSSRGIAEARKKTEAEVRALIDDGPVPAGGRACAPGSSTKWRTRTRCIEKLRKADGSDARETIDGERLRARQPASLGLNRGPRIAVIYAAGAIASGRERLRPAERRGGRLGHARSSHIRERAATIVGPRDRPAHRQPGRIGDGVRRHLARADDRAQRARRPADRRVDVRSRRVGRLLHRDARATSSSRSRRR